MSLVKFWTNLNPVCWYLSKLHEQEQDRIAIVREKISESCSELYIASERLEERLSENFYNLPTFVSSEELDRLDKQTKYFLDLSRKMSEMYIDIHYDREIESLTSKKAVDNFTERYHRFQSLIQELLEKDLDSNL